MNINELQITKDVKDTKVDWKNIFEKNGWKFLGKGAEASVGQHPTKNYVVKVWKRGSAYEQFLSFVKAHQQSPHVPRLGRDVRPVPGTDRVYVRMEKLSPVYNSSLMSTYYPEMVSLYMIGLKYKPKGMVAVIDDDLEIGITSHLLSLKLTNDMEQFLTPDLNKKLWSDVGAPPETWSQICEALVVYALQQGFPVLDLYADNFMRRGNKLVIADPFYRES